MQGDKLFDRLIEELPLEKEKEPIHIRLFRITKDISFDNMVNTFAMNPQNGEQFKLLKICLDNYQDLQKLQKFYPII